MEDTENVEDTERTQDDEEVERPVLTDDYVESVLAESLGVAPVAPIVVPVNDSQIPPDTYTGGTDGEEPDEKETLPYLNPEVADTVIDSPMPSAVSAVDIVEDSPPITPTEMEVTPPKPEDKPEVVPVQDSLPEVEDPMPSAVAKTSDPSDLDDVRARIEKIKQLSQEHFL